MDNSFFSPSGPISLDEIIAHTSAELLEPVSGDYKIENVAPIGRANSKEITFIKSRRSLNLLDDCDAVFVFCHKALAERIPDRMTALIVRDPQKSFSDTLSLFYPDALAPSRCFEQSDISPAAHIDPTANIEEGAIIEAGVVIGANASIGKGTVICANSTIGKGCQIGRHSSIGVGVSIANTLMGDHVCIYPGARLGFDGFGYVSSKEGHQKIPQVGRLIIQDHVDIGANTTIDRGAMDDTVIGEGTKIDNLVQIGHNVKIGRHCILVAQVGIAGSAILGDFVVLGGDVGVNGHITIGDGAQIAAKSAVPADVPAGAKWGGIPARPMGAFLRDVAEINARAFGRGKFKQDGDKNE